MPKFKFTIERRYTVTEGFEREYEAATEFDAFKLAQAEADESNNDCPDDCTEFEEGQTETTSFEAFSAA